MKITSRDNQNLKLARKVRDEKLEDKIFIEGLRLAEEALLSDLKVSKAFISDDFENNQRSKNLIERINSLQIDLFETSSKLFKSITATKNSQGIVLIADSPPTGYEIIENKLNQSKTEFPIILLLHKINNPSNLGAILRTSEAAGVEAVILTKKSTSPFSAKALRGAMGAGFRIPIWTDGNFSTVLNWATKKGFFSICADINGEKNYLQFDFRKPCLLVFGSEAHGLTAAERKLVSETVKVSLENEVESLNLAVACGVILFEAKRQQSISF